MVRTLSGACGSCQPSVNVGGGGSVGQVAVRGAVVDPGADQLLLLGRQPAVVGEVAVLRVGVPRRHPPVLDHLGDHVGPAGRLLVLGQRERPDLAGPMALDAAAVEDRGDVLGERDRAVRGRLLRPADQAAGDVGRRLADRLAGEQFVQSAGPGRGSCGLSRCTPTAYWSSIAAAVADDPLVVEHEHFRRAAGAEAVGRQVVQVLQDREGDAVLAGIGGDLGDAVLRVRVDADEADALRAVLGSPTRPAAGRRASPAGIRCRRRRRRGFACP